MPLISARNTDVLDVANIEDNGRNSIINRHSPVTIHNSSEDLVSVMTLHSAFQTATESGNYSSKNSSFTPTLTKIFSRDRDREDALAPDEFSVHSLPIQDSDIESVEQVWLEEQRKADDVLQQSRRFSTQTYSNKGTVRSSLHRFRSGFDEKSSTSRSFADTTAGDRSYIKNSSKTRGTARLVPMAEKTSNFVGNIISTVNTKQTKKKRNKNSGVPRPNGKSSSRSSRSTRDGTKSTQNETTNSINSASRNSRDGSQTSSNETSESTLEKEMFRLSVELANTLANLDVSNSEIARYIKQVALLQETVERLESDKAMYKTRLEGYEKKRTTRIETEERGVNAQPACVTPSRHIEQSSRSIEHQVFFSPDPTHTSSFSDPVHGSRDQSGLLFPELNESHISCPDLYASRVHDDFGFTIEEEEQGENRRELEVDSSVELIDPRDEVFDDDPFATLNYSNDSASTSGSSSGECDDDEDEGSIISEAARAREFSQPRAINTSLASHGSALSAFTDNLFRKKSKDSFRGSIAEQTSRFMKNVSIISNIAPSKRDGLHLNRSNISNMNISRIFKFGDGDDLSVSVRSHSSNTHNRNSFFNHQKKQMPLSELWANKRNK